MRLASANFTWPGLRPEFVLDLIAELGLTGVSLAFIGGYGERGPDAVAADPEAWGERIAGELAARGLEPADVFLIPSADYGTLSELIRFLMEDCCSGRPEICAPALATAGECAPASTNAAGRTSAEPRTECREAAHDD